ncbi:MAG: hypothetical protein NT169_18280 [Chloroflexi bacterium]|nr:hypothetical protein [Chloroflexota bacterium]
MSNYVTFPAEEVSHLIVEEMARDGQVRGATDATVIQAFHTGGEPEFVVEEGAVRLTGAAITRIFVPAGLAVTVKRAPGDLRVGGLTGDVNLEAVHGDLRLAELTGVARIAQAAGDLRAEGVADLRLLGSCEGDLRFDGGGNLEAGTVSGDLRVYGAQNVRAGRVRGDLWAEKLAGGLTLTRADGDARLSEIAGPVKLQALQGDLRANALTGGLAAAQVTGDVTLHSPFAEAEYTLTAEGDMSLHLPADADLRLTLRAGGRIRSDPRLTPAADGSPNFTATLGRGAGRMTLTVNGDLRISQAGAAQRADTKAGRGGFEARVRVDDLGNLGERIRQQVSASLAAAGINLETGEVNLGARGPKPPRPPESPRPPERPRPPSPPPAEEQLAILKMLETGKISAAEAETLLKALGV